MGLSIYVPLSVSTKSDYRDPVDLLKDVKNFIEVKNILKKNNNYDNYIFFHFE